MSIWRRLFSGFLNDSYGAAASAMFLVCLLSGILLVPFYDAADPYASLSLMLLYQPWAGFFRDLHFWSAQLFFVLSLIHLWGYLRPVHFRKLRFGIWFRLGIAIPLIFYLMFSGFLLKGDADSKHAGEIFRELLMVIPFLGSYLADFLLGASGNSYVTYIHHVASASIILLIIIREHARKLWTGYPTFVLAFVLSAILAFFLRAPLHDGANPLVKGPWYFLGIQELLHWLPFPSSAWYLLFVFLFLFIVLPSLRSFGASLSRWILLAMGCFFILATLFGIFFRAEGWNLTFPGSGANSSRYPTLKLSFTSAPNFISQSGIGKRSESCLICHDQFSGFSPGHEADIIGCHICHGGDKFSVVADLAHKGMRLVPGNLADASLSCATNACHPDILPRVERSLMSSNSGLVSVNRWVFGETDNPSLPAHVQNLGTSAADSHLRNLCAACHLGREKKEAGPIDENSRGGGCLACHIDYSAQALAQWENYQPSRGRVTELRRYVHPGISLQSGNAHCFGCHSRSGRIATNYEGWHETLLPLDSAGPAHRIVQGSRVFTPMPADVHYKAGMLCIDCHSARDVMGDGRDHRHKEDAVSIECSDCHRPGNAAILEWAELDYETRKIIKIRKIDTSLYFAAEASTGMAIPGARAVGKGQVPSFYSRKQPGPVLTMKTPAAVCDAGAGHSRLHCSSCHTAWASRCIGCHTGFDKERQGRDLLASKDVKGTWYELMGDFLAGPPGLGVVGRPDGTTEIKPVIPGMIMSIDRASYSRSNSQADTLFRRLFAVAEPHTTQSKGRSCVSCHNDPVALGYGGGELLYRHAGSVGFWEFRPEYADLADGLPADAWIGFLQVRNGMLATRSNVRPFSIAEQRRILEVGACLTCHEGNSRVMQEAIGNYALVRSRVSRKCILPDFGK